MYEIKLTYRTGHSLHTEITSDIIELAWNNLEIAKKNLKRIQEHYVMYQELNSYSAKKNNAEILDRNRNKEWFVDGKEQYVSESQLILIADNENSMQIGAFWTGYFETLYEAEIIVNDKDMKIEF